MWTLHSLSKEITHCWSPDLPGSLEAMIMQVLSKGKHLVSSLYRAYTFLQRKGRQKCVSTRERNYDWTPALSLKVTVWILQARAISTRTRAHSLKEREGSTEDALDLGKIRNAGGTPPLETLLHRIKYASGGFVWQPQGPLLHLIFCATINYLVFLKKLVLQAYGSWCLSHFFLPRKHYTMVGCYLEQFFPFVSARILVLSLNSWCNISPNQRAQRR